MPLYNDNPDGDWTAAHLALLHRFADYLTDSDRYDKPPLASPPQYNDWVYEIRDGPIPRKAPVSAHAPEVVTNDTFAELYIRSQLANQEKQAEIQNMGFEALIRQGIAAGQRKSGFRPKTRGFFNNAHDLGMAAMYARVGIRVARIVARIVPTLMTVLQLAVGRVPQLAVGRVHALTHFPPTAVRLPARLMQSLLARFERLSKRAEEEKRAYDARDVTMKDVEHTSTVAKASSSKQPVSSANLVETIASLNITAPRPSSTFSFNPQTSGSAADKDANPTMIPLPESDDEGKDDAMRGRRDERKAAQYKDICTALLDGVLASTSRARAAPESRASVTSLAMRLYPLPLSRTCIALVRAPQWPLAVAVPRALEGDEALAELEAQYRAPGP
ncbi:hypothetical protein B0H14DRAFT_3503138 [Mycena olivaceomarginata]|nr:hypothetical protein B0H14DRAFT_3503138 [Mycena olivaceomarginata]